jgi:hypothetical protein
MDNQCSSLVVMDNLWDSQWLNLDTDSQCLELVNLCLESDNQCHSLGKTHTLLSTNNSKEDSELF